MPPGCGCQFGGGVRAALSENQEYAREFIKEALRESQSLD